MSGFDIDIPAGAKSATGTFKLTPTADAIDETDETVAVSGAADNSATVTSATLTLTDDDTAGVTVVESDGATATTEAAGAGRTDRFTVVLTSEPTADVTIAVSSSDTGEATVSPASLTFTSRNWQTAQTVTVTGVDDDIDDDDQRYTVALAAAVSTDANYNALDPDDVSARNADDDGPPTGIALSVNPSAPSPRGRARPEVTVIATVTGSTTYGSDVTVTVSVTGSGTAGAVDFGAVSGFDIVIASGAGSATGTFKLTPTADAIDESAETVTVSGALRTTSATVTPATLTLTDDDTAGVTCGRERRSARRPPRPPGPGARTASRWC